MTTKAEYFDKHNGKQYPIGNDSYITCNLKKSWSQERMIEEVNRVKAEAERHVNFLAWRTKLLTRATELGYTEEEVAFTGTASSWQFENRGTLQESIHNLEQRLFRHPSKYQYGVVDKLLPDRLDHHIRLYGDGRIAVGSSKSVWYAIGLDGTYAEVLPPLAQTKLYSHNAFIHLSSQMGVEVQTQELSLRTYIYFKLEHHNSKWYKCEIWTNTEKPPAVTIGGYGGFDSDLADRAGDALKLGAAIAKDYQNFLDNPHGWLFGRMPRPYDAVLSKN